MPGSWSRPMPARSCVTPGSCRRSSARGSSSLATTSSTTTCRERIAQADFLYISHLHGDHHDEPWLREHLRRDIPILLPASRPASSSARCAALGFTEFIRTVDTEETGDRAGADRRDPRRDLDHRRSRRRLGARRVRRRPPILVNQNDCRTNDLAAAPRPRPGRSPLAAVLRRDLVPDGLRDARRRQARAVRGQGRRQFARAMRYVENVDARSVVPSAGPPALPRRASCSRST